MAALGRCVVVQLKLKDQLCAARDKDVSSGNLRCVLHFKMKNICSEVKGMHLGLKYLYLLETGF